MSYEYEVGGSAVFVPYAPARAAGRWYEVSRSAVHRGVRAGSRPFLADGSARLSRREVRGRCAVVQPAADVVPLISDGGLDDYGAYVCGGRGRDLPVR